MADKISVCSNSTKSSKCSGEKAVIKGELQKSESYVDPDDAILEKVYTMWPILYIIQKKGYNVDPMYMHCKDGL